MADDPVSPRLKLAVRPPYDSEQQRLLAEFERVRGYPVRGPFQLLLRSPGLFKSVREVGDYVRWASPLPAPLRELAILATARRWSQSYEWQAHRGLAIAAGLSPQAVDALRVGQGHESLTSTERAVLAFATELAESGHVSDRSYATINSELDEKQIVELVCVVGYYTLIAMILNIAVDEAVSTCWGLIPNDNLSSVVQR